MLIWFIVQCIFRKPEECKERHKVLMDQTPGDGADSAEDSGSSQPYPSTLPGIPKAITLLFIVDYTLNVVVFPLFTNIKLHCL